MLLSDIVRYAAALHREIYLSLWQSPHWQSRDLSRLLLARNLFVFYAHPGRQSQNSLSCAGCSIPGLVIASFKMQELIVLRATPVPAK